MNARIRPWLGGSAATVAILVAALVAPSAASAATAPITFDLGIFDECISGHAAPEVTVKLVWRDAEGALKAQGTTVSWMNSGYWEFCSSDTSVLLMSGDQIKADDGTNVRKYTVPDFSIVLNRVTNRATGTGPAHRTPRVCSTFFMFSDFEKCYGVRVGDDGTWSFNPNSDITGGIYASLNWTSPKGDHLFASTSAPLLRVTVGKAAFSGETAPLRDVEVVDSTNGGSGEATSDRNGNFSGRLVDSHGHLASVAVGDHVTAHSLSSDADWIVPDIQASGNPANDVVSGVCEQTGSVSDLGHVDVVRTGHVRGRAYVGLDATGHFSWDFGGQPSPGFDPANIKHGDKLVVGCMIDTGDWVQASFIVP